MIVVNLLDLFNDKKIDGVGHYGINLIKGLAELKSLNKFHFIIRENDKSIFGNIIHYMTYTSLEEPRFLKLKIYKKGFIKNIYYDRILLPKILRELNPKIFFNPYHSLTCYIPSNIKTVTTYHDLLYFNRRKDLSLFKSILSKITYRKNIRKTTYIITPSRYVKEDLLKNYQSIEEEKITVLPNPIHINKNEISEYSIDRNYILSVNSILPHKNLITLLKAFYFIMDKVEHNLVLVGKKGKNLDSEMKEYIEKIGKQRLKITGYISNAKRNYLYKNASLFISPSVHEGFGMTPIEAALFEVPVITTLKTSIPETSMNLLNYYDPPDDYKKLANKMLEMLNSKKESKKLEDIRKMYEKEYSIKNVAKAYLDYFEKIE